ncbi:MAG: amino acid transporter [Actinomycetota bacterium]|nr:amino acid transporter [Actinomycetota bacterium]
MSKRQRDFGPSDVVEVLGWLEGAGLCVWVDGGWGHDAVLGEQTRRHDDLDLIVDSDESARLIVALTEHGFTVTERDSPDAFVLEDADGRQVDVHCVRFDTAGNGLYRMSSGEDWPFPAGGLKGRGTIGGRGVRCMTPEQQVLCKIGEFEPTEADFQDLRLLHGRFGVEIPQMYRNRA